MTPVFESEDPQVPEEGTTEDPGVPDEGTTESDPTDGEETSLSIEEQIQTAVQAESAKLQEKAEQDLSNLRSSLDRRYAEAEKGWEQQEKSYRDKLFELETADMDENELLKHQYNLANEQIITLEQAVIDGQTKVRELTSVDGYVRFFADINGISRADLVMDQGLDAVVQSGWKAVEARMKELEAQAAGEALPPETPPETPPNAPDVLTDQGGIPTGKTEAELIKQYGSMEEVYRLVEQQLLDPSIIPVDPETS